MAFVDQLSGGIRELHQGFARDSVATVCGVSFKPVVGRIAREKTATDAGFIAAYDAVFTATADRFKTVDHRTILGKVLTFEKLEYIVIRIENKQVTTDLICRAKNA